MPAEPDIPIRIYHPHADRRPRPVVVYFHGGGFVLCDLDTHDGVCRLLARDADVVVVAVHYRRSPEHRYPAAVRDAYQAGPALGAKNTPTSSAATRTGWRSPGTAPAAHWPRSRV